MKKLINANTGGGQRRAFQVFRDFCELAALTIRNAVDHAGHDEREARYRQIIAGYSADEAERFAEMLAWVTLELSKGMSDVLGHQYMHLDFGNERLGQFFTPYDVSVLTARMTVGDLLSRLGGEEFLTLAEPACGSGGMVIATADSLRDAGVNYQTQLHVTATDLDVTAVHMTYVQLSLLHIPALVVHGNTLTMDVSDVWRTPAHVWGGWEDRLAERSLG